VDASVIDIPLRPKGKTTYKNEREDKQETEIKEYASSKDASWLKKIGK